MWRSVVVQRHPHMRRWLVFAAVLGVIVAAIFGTQMGRYGSIGLFQSLMAENEALRQQNALWQAELNELRQWKTNQQTREEVSGHSLEMVRREMAQQQELIAELEQGVHFYRSLMAPGDQPEGLSVRSINLARALRDDTYLFRILVQQNARKHELLSGVLRVDVIGTENGEPSLHSLASMSSELPSEDIKLRFKYFQAIDGEFTLPRGFVPSKMVAYAKAVKPRQVEVSRDFPWAVQERITHVGK